MAELRQKMIRAMELKNLSPHTQRAYLAAVAGLARHYRQSPTAISKEMIEDYLLALKKTRASNSCGLVLTGLRFFYAHVAEEKLQVDYRMRKKARKLPTVLTPAQVAKIISACDNLKHRLILMSTYAAGLRASEVAALKPEHIDSQRMLINLKKYPYEGLPTWCLYRLPIIQESREHFCLAASYIYSSIAGFPKAEFPVILLNGMTCYLRRQSVNGGSYSPLHPLVITPLMPASSSRPLAFPASSACL